MAKYWRLRLKGDLSPDQVQSALPEGAINLLHVHKDGGETHVYFAAAEAPGVPKAKAGQAENIEEVSLDVVTRIA
jgi:hypothetical protein